MGITDGNIIYSHGVSEGNVNRKISTLDYNNRTFYECFDDLFKDDFISRDLNIPRITFNYRPRPHKRARYTPDMLPASISVASENSFNTLNAPFLFAKSPFF